MASFWTPPAVRHAAWLDGLAGGWPGLHHPGPHDFAEQLCDCGHCGLASCRATQGSILAVGAGAHPQYRASRSRVLDSGTALEHERDWVPAGSGSGRAPGPWVTCGGPELLEHHAARGRSSRCEVGVRWPRDHLLYDLSSTRSSREARWFAKQSGVVYEATDSQLGRTGGH